MKTTRFKTIPDLYLPTFGVQELERLLTVARRFNITKMRFTPGSQIAVAGLNEEDVEELRSILGSFMSGPVPNGLGRILTCPGCGECRYGTRNTEEIATRIGRLDIKLPLPAPLKIAVAGCRRCCTMPRVRDVGLLPGPTGWSLSFGGNGGADPRIGDILGQDLSEDELLVLVQGCLSVYIDDAKPGERSARYMERTGITEFSKKITNKLAI
jgi:NAD(P)H-nitrite reductase large subunit